MKINILALDSASSVCGVSLLEAHGGQVNVRSAHHSGSTQHAERILPLVEDVLRAAKLSASDLNAIAFAQGPGGFTGLRVACGVAQGLAYALGLQVAAVPSLLAIAAQQTPLEQESIEVVITDARMQELYVGVYQRTATGWYSFHKPILISVPQFQHYLQALQQQQIALETQALIRISGDALVAFEGLAQELTASGYELGGTDLAHSETIARLALLAYEQNSLIAPALAAPLYVRNRVAFTIAERETGLGGNPSANWQSVQIRAMEKADSVAVAALVADLQLTPWSEKQVLSSLEAGHWAWVAEFENKVIAYAILMPAADECELLLLGVAKAHQRQGIAQQLLCYAEQHARAQGCKAVHLEVRISNSAAIELYQSADYRRVGLRRSYYIDVNGQREDAVLYTKVIA